MAKINERVKIARQFKKEMAALSRQQDILYRRARKTLKITGDDWSAFDYFYNDPVGCNSFEESLKIDGQKV